MNTDPEDTWLAIGAGISITVFGVCVLVAVFREHCVKHGMKQSRSDNDLTQLTGEPSEEQCASPQAPASTASSHTE
jgi:hypothetical protein